MRHSLPSSWVTCWRRAHADPGRLTEEPAIRLALIFLAGAHMCLCGDIIAPRRALEVRCKGLMVFVDVFSRCITSGTAKPAFPACNLCSKGSAGGGKWPRAELQSMFCLHLQCLAVIAPRITAADVMGKNGFSQDGFDPLICPWGTAQMLRPRLRFHCLSHIRSVRGQRSVLFG